MRILTNQRTEDSVSYLVIVEIDENKLEKTLKLVRENNLNCASFGSTQKKVEVTDLIDLIGDENVVATKFGIDYQRTTLDVDSCEILEQKLCEINFDFDGKTDMPCSIMVYPNGNVNLTGYLNNISGEYNQFGTFGQKSLRNYV
jgi:hypothetical protein